MPNQYPKTPTPPDRTAVCIRMPKSVHRSAKIRAVQQDRSLQDYVVALIERDILGDPGDPA